MNDPAEIAPPKVEIVNLPSKLLGKQIFYTAIIPSAVETEPRSVLYLLHGLFGSHQNWTAYTRILEYAARKNFLIVCPDACDGWYTDTPVISDHNYESFIFEEIIPHAEARFSCGMVREKRTIAGNSMGGYGAFKFAFRRPEMFCFAASMSGAFHAAEIFSDGSEKRAEAVPSIMHIFGENKVLRAGNSLHRIVASFPEEVFPKLPRLYFDCGTDDEFFAENIKLSNLLESRGIAHRFEKLPGGHGWEYWDANLKNIIDLAGSHFEKESDTVIG